MRWNKPIYFLFIMTLCYSAHAFWEVAQAQSSSAFDNEGAPINITSDRLIVKEKQDIAIFEGHVVATQEGSTLKSDKLEVQYGTRIDPETGKEERAAKILIATGSVTLILPDQHITGDRARYDLGPELMVIEGNVVVEREAFTLTGYQLVADMRTNLTRVFSKDGKPVNVNLNGNP